MSIKVNTYQLQCNAAYSASIASKLSEKADQISSICYSLDLKVKGRQGIGRFNTQPAEQDGMAPRFEEYKKVVDSYALFLDSAAERYDSTETLVNTNESVFK